MTNWVKDIVTSAVAPGGTGSLYWRERTLKILLVAGLSLGLPAIVSSLFLIVQERLWGLLILDVTMFLSCFIMLLVRRLKYGFRAAVSTLMMYGLGLSIICYLGPVIGGLAWLFAFAVLAGALLGVRAALAALTLNGLTLALVWLLTTTGRFGASSVAGLSLALDVANGANFLFMNAVAAIAVALLVRKLDATILKEMETSEKLDQERRELVKTNIQLNREVEVRKNTETALRRSEETYRLLADNVHDNIWVLSLPDPRFTYVSPSVERILGYTVEEAEALSLEDILTPASLDLTMKVIGREMAEDSRARSPNRSPTLELEEYRRDGTTVWVEVTTTFVRGADGRVKELIGVTRDITPRKEAEAALKESQEKYHSILESSPDPVVQYDMEGRVIYVNPAFTRVFGWTLEELAGHQIEFVPSEARSENRQRFEQIKRGESFYGFETRRHTKAGR
ncbi:MAG: PAS domain S-box protein, partial [Proteobacteria bacterium]|nr:PAS domain S-box protein [Pseudomonadota bacterium]